MSRLLVVSIALLMTPALLAIANASPCDSDGQPALGVVELPALHGRILYVDDRNVAENGLWVYEEINGYYEGNVPGSIGIGGHLQRGDWFGLCQPVSFPPCWPDLCVDPRIEWGDVDWVDFAVPPPARLTEGV